MIGRTVPVIHVAICIALIFFFGPDVHSLSADFAQHFALIYSLMKNGAPDPQIVGFMSTYPNLGHWVAAGTGYIVGSGLVAMWLISILSIYTCYYCFGCIAAIQNRTFGALLLSLVIIISSPSRAVVGWEVVGNFFYPQVVATAGYSVFLLMLADGRIQSVVARLAIALAFFAFTLRIHTVPALHIAGLFWILLVVDAIIECAIERAVRVAALVPIAVFPACALLVMWLDPTVRTAMSLSNHDGSLEFRVAVVLIPLAAFFALILHAMLLFMDIRNGRDIGMTDRVVFAALATGVGIVVAQYCALKFLGLGSPYAVKKHFFIMITVAAISITRSIGRLLPEFHVALNRPLLSSVLAAAICVFLLYRPGISLYPVLKQLTYAERAASFPEFRRGNTFAVAASIHPVIRYLITLTAFQVPPDDPRAIGLIYGTFKPERDASFVMVDRTEDTAKCESRYAESPQFVILPVACVQR